MRGKNSPRARDQQLQPKGEQQKKGCQARGEEAAPPKALRAALGWGWGPHALPAVAPLLLTSAARLAAPRGIPRARLQAVVQGDGDDEEEEDAQ